MNKHRFVVIALLAAGCAGDKDDAKGVVDDSQPPATPTELGKADASGKEVAVTVQSAHPYTNNLDKLYAVPLTALPSCASEVRVHFKLLRTEDHYDFVTVEPSGAPIQSFDGSHDDTWTAWFAKAGTKVNVRLDSDGSVTRHGFEIDKLEWAGAPVCPAIAYPPCATGKVDVTPAPAVCGCPTARVCVAPTDVAISHGTRRRFAGSAHSVHGNVASETHPGPTDAPQTTAIGTLPQARVTALVERAAALGLLHGAGYDRPITTDTAREDLAIDAGPYHVTFVASEGAHDAKVAQLIADFEALFTCETPTGGLACGTGFQCEDATCVQAACTCAADDAPVCTTGGTTYANACEAGCANAPVVHAGACGVPGDPCGTIRGLTCQDANRCRYAASTFMAPFPDAGGACVASTYCDAPADCTGLAHPAVLGAWACAAQSCTWAAGVPWKPVTDGRFETAHPYASATSVWKELSLPAGAQALRLTTASGFALEANFDFLEVWTWTNGAWKLDHRYTGTTGPAATEEFPGRYHYLRFVSDSSVNKQGFRIDAEYR